MEVQERVEVLAAVGVEAPGVALRDVRVAKFLAHHRPVLGLGQAVGASSQLRRVVTLSVDLSG